MTRPTWDQYFLDIAEVVASRSTCFRRKVGAVIVHDKKIVSTGYNGAPKYQKNCGEIGFCYRDKNNIESLKEIDRCRAIGSHAESNAICLAAKDGTSTSGSTIYMVGHVDICVQCRAMIANSGIIRAVLRKVDGEIQEHNVKDWNSHFVDSNKKNHY